LSHSGFAFGESGDALLWDVRFPVSAEQRFVFFVDAQVNEAIAAVRLQLSEHAGFGPFQRLFLSGAKANWRARSIVARIRQASDHSPKTDLCNFGSAWHSASRNFIQAL
jgi:hypothetical protein